MKKIITMLMLMMASMVAYAGTSANNTDDLNGVIPLSVATGMWRANLGYDKEQNLIVCQRIHRYLWKDESCRDKDGNNAWAKIKDAVPKGKTFVGFKSVSQGSEHYIEIYWK
jgi:hypothetical protein